MTRLTVRVFGLPVLSFDLNEYELVEEEDEECPTVGGGSAHNFTLAAPFVDERYLPWDDEDSAAFGFKR